MSGDNDKNGGINIHNHDSQTSKWQFIEHNGFPTSISIGEPIIYVISKAGSNVDS